MTNYAAHVSRRVTPQTRPIPDSTQVANSAGGFSWPVDDKVRFDRFLILGAAGGTYYIKEQDLVKQNHDAIVKVIKTDGLWAVNRIVEVSDSGRAYKNDPALFALALAVTHGDDATKKAALQALPKVARIGTHLFHFCEFVNQLRGWGRGLRNGVAKWYLDQPVEKLAQQVVKYQQRDGWSHRDVLRLTHPKTENAARDAILRWATGGSESLPAREVKRQLKDKADSVMSSYSSRKENLPAIIEAFEQMKVATTDKQVIKLILDHDLPRECVPTQFLNDPAVWEALLHKMPLTAMIRNLGKMTSVGLIKPLSAAQKKVVAALGDAEALKKARIHPLAVLVALKTYAAGHGDKGSLAWTPLSAVSDALDGAFYASFGSVQPIGKPVLLGLDVSGSMSQACAGAPISCAEGVAAMALITASVEKDYHIMAFDQGIRDLDISPRMRLDEVLRKVSNINGGGTDCALPMLWAKEQKVKVGGFFVYTDSETYAGAIHPAQALKQYRDAQVADARQVVIGMASNGFTIADPNDRYAMDVVGFDTAVPNVISAFVRED